MWEDNIEMDLRGIGRAWFWIVFSPLAEFREQGNTI
jgi:hypothetical protein